MDQIKSLLKRYLGGSRLLIFYKCLKLKEEDSLNCYQNTAKIQITFPSNMKGKQLIEK